MLGYKRQVFSEDQIVSSAAGKESLMFRLWGKEFKDNRMLCDTVICDETDDTRTHKIFHALDKICYEFDLSKPIWLDSTINEFKRHAKARSIRTILSMRSTLTIWRFRLLKNNTR